MAGYAFSFGTPASRRLAPPDRSAPANWGAAFPSKRAGPSLDAPPAAFDAAVLAYGGVDIVVSNAGISSFGRLESLDAGDWDRSFAVNARGHFLVARAAMRVMIAQGIGGSIVFNASKNVTAPG